MNEKRKIVVGFSGGVTSAWCGGWALRNYPREDVALLWHDTKEEHPDTIRFLREMAAALDMPITERSDGRSVTQLFHDEGLLGNGQNTMCSRILKVEPGKAYVRELQAVGYAVTRIVGFSANEPKRVAHMVGRGLEEKTALRFPIIEENITKQQCADWCISLGVQPSAMYCWAEHANCLGCVKGGRAYFLALREHHPDVFEQRAQLEEEFGHSIIRGYHGKRTGNESDVTLRQLVTIGLKRKVGQKEKIEIGACDCGD